MDIVSSSPSEKTLQCHNCGSREIDDDNIGAERSKVRAVI